jgi:WD40 repeat protein
MLQNLPVEVVQQIVGHLPTASSTVNLSRTNRKINSIISADDYSVFRSFVQQAFPTLNTPPIWKDAARVLTSRSRAWHRRAFIARECHPGDGGASVPQGLNAPRGAAGYRPIIDSYEVWEGTGWSDRREVLVWGAASRLILRTTDRGSTCWTSLKDPSNQDIDPSQDILAARLLRPTQNRNSDGETVIIGRANREVLQVQSTSASDGFAETARYTSMPSGHFCLDVSSPPEPLLVACGDTTIKVYPVHSTNQAVDPVNTIKIEDRFKMPVRKCDVKFLSPTTIAVANQLLDGRLRAPVDIYNISNTGLSATPLVEVASLSETKHPIKGRHSANAIIPLQGPAYDSNSNLLLTGWTDGIARLYDLRKPHSCVSEYTDSVDDGAIVSLLAMGHERFLAGGAQNGCLKTFDLRIPGAKPYSYLDARPSPTNKAGERANPAIRRDFNIFVTPTVSYRERLWQPLSRQNPAAEKYRGSVYSLSSPSSSSPTVYAGISNHVLQLDFLSTDDVRRGWHTLDHPQSNTTPVIDLSCYEQPRRGRESTDPVLLRKQQPLVTALAAKTKSADDGWDERWMLNTGRDDPERRNEWNRGQRGRSQRYGRRSSGNVRAADQ